VPSLNHERDGNDQRRRQTCHHWRRRHARRRPCRADPVGGLLEVQEFPATAAGYADLLGWLFGTIALVGVEVTGSYGAGLARHLAAATTEGWIAIPAKPISALV
jgi:hypothetical protein